MSYAFFILSGRSRCFGGHFPIFFRSAANRNFPCILRLYLIGYPSLYSILFYCFFIRPLLSKLGSGSDNHFFNSHLCSLYAQLQLHVRHVRLGARLTSKVPYLIQLNLKWELEVNNLILLLIFGCVMFSIILTANVF